MERIMLKSKIHRATITGADLEYEAAIRHEPKLLFVDDKNRMLPTRAEEAGQARVRCIH